jgi:hypothetical protein
LELTLPKTLEFSFTGKNNGADMSIELSDGDGHPMAEMRIGGDGAVYLSGEEIGDVDLDPHTIVFTMFTSSLKYNVTIIQASGTVKAENKPMITDNLLSFSNPAHPMVSFVRIAPTDGQYYSEVNSKVACYSDRKELTGFVKAAFSD